MDTKLFITFTVIAFGILIAPIISNLLKIPLAIGEILFGILLGIIKINTLIDPFLTKPFSYFGFLLLMFLAGLEIKIRELKDLSFEDSFFIILPVILNFLFSTLVVIFFKLPIFFILVFSLISVGIIVSVLRELNLLKTQYGKHLFFIGILGEAFSLVLLTAFSLFYKFKYPYLFIKEVILLILVSIIAYLILKIFYLLVWWFPNKFFVIFTKEPGEFGVRLSLGALLILSSLFAFANIEPILGAFIAGLIFGNVIKQVDLIEEKFSGFSYGFFIPVFFINIGLNFSFPEIDIFYFLKIFFLFLLVKILSHLPLAIKYDLKTSIASALLMSAPLTLLVALAEFGKALGVISEDETYSLILLSILTGILCPSLFKLLFKPDKVLKES